MSAHCHATGRSLVRSPEMLMCDQHWGMVPKPIQRAVLATCRGARDAPNRARAIAAAIGAVALQEGQPISQRQALAAFDYGVRHERLDPQKSAAIRAGSKATTIAKDGVEPCWYCGAPGVLLCDAPLGVQFEGVTDEVAAKLVALPLGRLTVLDLSAFGFADGSVKVITCDASACARCAREHGWKQPMHARVCFGGGKSSTWSRDLCHAHASADALPAARISDVEINEKRARLRAACGERHGHRQHS